MSVYSWVSPAMAAFKFKRVPPNGRSVAGSPHCSRYKMTVCVAGFALGSGAEHRRDVVLPFDVGFRRKVKVAAVCLRFPRKCRLEIAVGLGAFELHVCLRVSD